MYLKFLIKFAIIVVNYASRHLILDSLNNFKEYSLFIHSSTLTKVLKKYFLFFINVFIVIYFFNLDN